MSRKRILVVGITLIIILFAFIFFQRNNYHAVVLYENGFHPKNISILIGETVYFSTERREPFLIESVILKPETTSTYPIDPKYREFKSTRPITYKSPWSFTFEREGIWHYQDLLNPQYAGIIFVFSEAANLQEHKDIEQYIIELCGTEGDAQINNCLEKVITRKAQDKNTESAFQIFEYLYHTDKDFRYNCSEIARTIGEIAYKKFTYGKEVSSTIKTKYCDYAFFQGFIDALVADSQNFNTAREFCLRFDSQRSRRDSYFSGCFHGLGYAATWFYDHNYTNLSLKNAVSSGVRVCKTVTVTSEEKERCGGGIFNALANIHDSFSRIIDEDNPFAICHSQDEYIFKKSCYRMFKSVIASAGNGTFAHAAQYILQITEKDLARAATYDLASHFTKRIFQQNVDLSEFTLAHDCQTLPIHLRTFCIEGIISGIIGFGISGKEYMRGLVFCSSNILNDEEKEACYKQLTWVSSVIYDATQLKKICGMISDKYISTKKGMCVS